MKRLLQILLVFLFAIIANSFQAQPWNSLLPKDKVENNNLTFFEIQKAFNDYWAPKNVVDGYYQLNGVKTKAGGWKQFKRWEWYWENRVDPVTGAFPNTSAFEEYQKIANSSGGQRSPEGQWTSMGPGSSPGGYAGLGRLNCIGFHPTDNNILYVGAASGGVWKSVDGGSTWDPKSDNIGAIGISDIIVQSTTGDDVVYIATGDRDAGDTYSVGILKSTDGGATWANTGLVFSAGDGRLINRLLVDPTDDNIFYAATSLGVYKSTDAGVSWNLLTSTNFIDLEFRPNMSNIIYGGTKQGDVYKTTDSGTNWNLTLSTSGKRTELAVSPNSDNVVYALVAASDNGLYGIYKSTNSGDSFTVVYNGPNLLGWDCSAGGSGGQGWYDLCIASDPNDAATVFIGGVNTWKSTDSGSTWYINNHWSSTCGGASTVVHADKHNLTYQNGSSTLFECNDGGLYSTSNGGSTWAHLSNGLIISQMYKLGVAQTTPADIITGLQDNGTKALLSSTWTDVIGGDGMECLIDYSNENTQYGSLYYGNIRRTTNHWASQTIISGGIGGSAAWVTPYVQDPNNSNTLYVGFQDVWKSTNQGDSWTQLSSWGGSTLRSLTVAPSNSNYIYAATLSILYGTSDGGSNWSNITGSLLVGSSNITYISVKHDDPNTIWVAMGQFNNYGVFESTDAGSTWTDISTGLPTLPTNCVIQNRQNTIDVELYAATDVGVYMKYAGADWVPYFNDMPNVVVAELDIYYDDNAPVNSMIRAATYGRGLWESDLYLDQSVLGANFSADVTSIETEDFVQFTDASTGSPTSWEWTFPGGDPAFYTGQTPPPVQYNAAGIYDVSLEVSDGTDTDTHTKTDYIEVIFYPWGYVNGYVTDLNTSAAIEDAAVSISNGTDSYSFNTNVNGYYEGQVLDGNYNFEVSSATYETSSLNDIYIEYETTVTNDFALLEYPFPVNHVYATEQDANSVLVNWDWIATEEWLYYDDGINVDGIGGPATFSWAIKFDPAQLTDYDGTSVTKIRIYNKTTAANTLQIFEGSNAETLLYEQDLTGLEVETWNEVILTSAVPIDINKELWITIYTEDGVSYPGGCGNATGDPNGDLISLGGGLWDHLSDFGLNYTWNLGCFVTDAVGGTIPLGDFVNTNDYSNSQNELPVITGIENNSTQVPWGNTINSINSNREMLSYNIYRALWDDNGDNMSLVGNTTDLELLDTDWGIQPSGVYKWAVQVVYTNNNSVPTNSNYLDKDMWTVMDVEVSLNTGDSPEGVNFTLTNISEPYLNLVYELNLDATGYGIIDPIRKGTYEVKVSLFGYQTIYEFQDIYGPTNLSYILDELLTEVTNLYVNPNGYTMWDIPDPSPLEIFAADFEGGIPDNITVIEGPGTNYWIPYTDANKGDVARCNWGYDIDTRMNTPLITLNENTIVQFAWNGSYYWNIDPNANGDLTIEISLNEGLTWQSIWSFTDIGVWTSYTWYETTIDLANLGYSTGDVMFSVHMVGDDNGTVNFDDLYIGAAEVIATTVAISTIPEIDETLRSSEDVFIEMLPNNLLASNVNNDANRSLQSYQISLDEVFSGNTADLYYDYEVVESLIEGTEYIAKVEAEYTTGLSEPAYYTFTYHACDYYNAATNFTATRTDGSMNYVLAWTNDINAVDTDEFVGTNIYRDGELIAFVPSGTETYSEDLVVGEYNYCITQLYQSDAESCEVCADAIMLGTYVNGYITEFTTGDPIEGVEVALSGNNAFTFTTDANGFYEGEVFNGTYNYTISANSYESELLNDVLIDYGSTVSNDFALMDFPYSVGNVLATEQEDHSVLVDWSGIPQWLYYDDGTNIANYGSGSDFTIAWASKYDHYQLLDYENYAISKIQYYGYTLGATVNSISVMIWSGDNASTLLYSEDVTSQIAFDNSWNEFYLASEVPFDNTEALWIGFYAEAPGGCYPASFGGQSISTTNADYINYNANGWQQIADWGNLGKAWNTRAFVTSEFDESIALNPMPSSNNLGKAYPNGELEFITNSNPEASRLQGFLETTTSSTRELIFFEDFETQTHDVAIDLAGWQNTATVGGRVWLGKEFEGNIYAQALSYNSGEENTCYLITPAINLDDMYEPQMKFISAQAYWNHNGLSVLISTDYDGTNIETANWETLNCNLAGESNSNYEWVNSGIISLNNYSGNAHIAFKYVGNGDGSATTSYLLDNIEVYEGNSGPAGYNVYRGPCNASPEDMTLLTNTTEKQIIDNTAEPGVYSYAVEVVYENNMSEFAYSNCVDVDMITTVSVAVSTNSGDSPEGTTIMFTNINEPWIGIGLELNATGMHTWTDFRKGIYDISVRLYGFEQIIEEGVSIWDESDFEYLLIEKIVPPLGLYVTPTGYASWTNFEPYFEDFDEGLPEEWTIIVGGSTTDTWFWTTDDSGNTLDGTPFMFVDSDAAGTGSTMDEMLISPIIENTEAADMLFVEFDYIYQYISNEYFEVDVFDGDNWVNIFHSEEDSGPHPWGPTVHEIIDVTEYANLDFQVQFHYVSNGWNWYVAVDNFSVNDGSNRSSGRSLNYYKVWLDGAFITDSDTTFYNYGDNGETLVSGDTYLTEVATVYTTGVSEKVAFEWTYYPCDSFPGPEQFNAESVEGTKDVLLSWSDNPPITSRLLFDNLNSTNESVVIMSTSVGDNAEQDQSASPRTINGDRAMWDVQYSIDIDGPSGLTGLAGGESDGNFIYATKWAGSEIVKFDVAGNYIETFSIPGVSGLRDLAFDGTYMYGAAASTTVYKMDFTTGTLVSSFTAPVAVRAIAYDEDDDAFWGNNWSADLVKFDATGATLGTLTAPPSIYGMAYDNFTDGGPFLWLFSGTTSGSGCQLEQMDIASGTLTGVSHSVSDDFGDYIAGGLYITEDLVTGTRTIGGTAQGTPNIAFGYEIGISTGSIGTNVYRDDVLIAERLIGSSFVDEELVPGYYDYCITYVYESGAQSCEICVNDVLVPEDCNPPQGLSATIDENTYDNVYLEWDQATEVEYRYDDGVATGNLGWTTGTTNSVLGSVHRSDTELTQMSWFLTDYSGPHDNITIYVMGLDDTGLPDGSNVLFSQSVSNIDLQWNTYEFDEPIDATGGFYLAVAYNGFVALGIDDGVGEPWPFIENTSYYNSDYATNAFATYESAGFSNNAMIRAIGFENAVASYAVEPTSVNNNSKPDYIELETFIEAGEPNWSKPIVSNNREFTGYNIYRDGEMIEEGYQENTYTDTDGIYFGNGYCYNITKMYSICGESEPSNEACVSSELLIQTIGLNTGWNMVSFYVIPDDMDLLNILQPLVTSQELVKVIDEAGGFIQDIPGTGWMNTIGDMVNTEGYYIKVSNITSLEITGMPVSSSYSIPLTSGWNMMSYPYEQSQDAMEVLQQLIDDNQLVKVINENGDFIQNIPGVGWMNTIGDLEGDEGYYIKVNTNTSLDYGDGTPPWQCGDAFEDPRDGQTYNTVLIGNQCWMAENLNVGTRIDGVDEQTDNSTNEKYCYNDDEAKCDTYGGLYQWDEMMEYVTTEGVQGICPDGWYLPSDGEWKTMEMQLGMSQSQADAEGWRGTNEGEKMKSTSGWNNNGNGTNSSGFTALPGGRRGSSGSVYDLGYYGYWWSGTERSGTHAWGRHLNYGYGQVRRTGDGKTYGFSVRCLKD